MAKLLFFDPTHTYTLDGEVIPSVSEITRFMSREIYGDLQQNTLDRAAGRGTAVHKATEVLDKYGTVEASDDIVPYVRGYVQFLREHSVEWVKIEYAVVSPEKDYAGTLDRYGTVDGKRPLADIKAISALTPGHRKLYEATLNLYRMAIEAEYPVERLLIIWLRKDGTYKLFELPIDDTLANACRALHQALKKKPRKKKKEETSEDAE
jgi:hypothetical protein